MDRDLPPVGHAVLCAEARREPGARGRALRLAGGGERRSADRELEIQRGAAIAALRRATTEHALLPDRTSGAKRGALGRRHVRPAGFPALRPADQRPEGLALSAPVLGRRFHGIERFGRLVPVAAAEVLALLEDHHPALRGTPR